MPKEGILSIFIKKTALGETTLGHSAVQYSAVRYSIELSFT